MKLKNLLCIAVAAMMTVTGVSAKKKQTRITIIGDSITAGIGTENPETDSYPAQLAEMLGKSMW